MHSVQMQIAASRDGDADLKQARDCALGHLYSIRSLCLNKSLDNEVLFTFSEGERTTTNGFKIPCLSEWGQLDGSAMFPHLGCRFNMASLASLHVKGTLLLTSRGINTLREKI